MHVSLWQQTEPARWAATFALAALLCTVAWNRTTAQTTWTVNDTESLTTDASYDNIFIGNGDAGTLNHTGGTLSATSGVTLGNNATDSGTYKLSGNAALSAYSETIGYSGSGTFIQDGGTNSSTFVTLAYKNNSRGTYVLNGGTFSSGELNLGYRYYDVGAATFTQNGGTVAVSRVSFNAYSNNANSSATYNFNGGILQAGSLSVSGDRGTFNFNGGTLQPTGTNSPFITNVKLVVQAGGAVIDTQVASDNGAFVSFSTGTVLVHDTALGSTADGGLTKLGDGRLTLAGTSTLNNSYTGPTVVNAGTLRLANPSGVALSATSRVTVNNGGTLLMGGNNQLNQAVPPAIFLGTSSGAGIPAKLDAGGFSQGTRGTPTIPGSGTVGLGALTLASSAVIDLRSTSVLHFSNSSANIWTGTLAIWDWTGTRTTGGGLEQILFGSDATGLNATQLSQISFYSDAGQTLLANTALILADGEIVPGSIVPVPEPTTWLAGCLALGTLGYSQRRRAVLLLAAWQAGRRLA